MGYCAEIPAQSPFGASVITWNELSAHIFSGRFLSMNCNNGFGGCWWIIILILLFCCCGGNSMGLSNGCGCCENNNNCGCGC